MSVFAALDLIEDEPTRSAAMNMALDEALLELVVVPTLRVYRWDHAALSFGYFGRFRDVAAEDRDLVRRWTGGGIVRHGEDLTYALIIPASASLFGESSMSIYEATHAAIENALRSAGCAAELASVSSPSEDRTQTNACFANPVRADVMLNGRKIAGAAQRRTGRGLLQQGSIQGITVSNDFVHKFGRQLAGEVRTGNMDNRILTRGAELAAEKYATLAWLQRR